MSDFEVWGDVGRFETAGDESTAHLWGKVELERRRQAKQDPWFQGEYRYERKVADRVPDCAVLGDELNWWIEFVAGSDQPYREKTREALRLGYVMHWVFHVDCEAAIKAAKRELNTELKYPFQFGVFDPDAGMLDLGDPITFKNYAFPVESMGEFEPGSILGYRRGAAGIRRHCGGFDLGVFQFGGCQRRLLTLDPDGSYFRSATPGRSLAEAPWGFPTRDGLERLVEAGEIERLGPVGHGQCTTVESARKKSED